MAGNSQRRGAMRKDGTKKGATVGSGGQRRRGAGGPGPDARRRGAHRAPGARGAPRRRPSAPRRAPAAAVRRTATGVATTTRRRSSPAATRSSRRCAPAFPATALYVAARHRRRRPGRARRCSSPPTRGHRRCWRSPRDELDRITGGARAPGPRPAGAGVRVRPPGRPARGGRGRPASPALIVALDGVTDPRNLGAVVRSVAAFGGHGVVVPERRAAGHDRRRPGRPRRALRPGCRWRGRRT